MCLLTMLLANWTIILYLLVDVGNCGAIAELEILNLYSDLGIGHSRREWLFCTEAYFRKAVD